MSISRLMQMAAANFVDNAWTLNDPSIPTYGRFNITGETSVQGIFFKPDGTKMYIIGTALDSVVEYNLSTAWDVSTAIYVQDFSVAAEETTPTDLFFKDDGTKLYVLGGTGVDVNEYNLSTAWDISTASYAQSFSVTTQETAPKGIFFKPDGTKMYITGTNFDVISEYALSTPWDISTASYVQNFSVAAQETAPNGLFFKPDGTKMYIVGLNADHVVEYSLSAAWDISSASYVQRFNIIAENSVSQGLFFKPDGSRIYILGVQIFTYTLSTAWDVSTASWDAPANSYFSVYTEEINPSSLSFKPDGTKLYVLGPTGDDVNEYNLSTPWDISTATYVQNFSVITQETTPNGLFFKPDGTKMYIVGSAAGRVNEYNLSTAWDISTATHVQNFSVATEETSPQGVYFKLDGTKMYITGASSDAVWAYDLSTAWDISTASMEEYGVFVVVNKNLEGLYFKPDGLTFYALDTVTDSVFQYSLSTAWNISTAVEAQSFSVSEIDKSPKSILFKSDGSKMYILGNSSDAVWTYSLSTPWDISTATLPTSGQFAISETEQSEGVFFKPDGTKMYIVDRGGRDVREYTLSTAWDITTASYRESFLTSTSVNVSTDIFFKPDGTKMYIISFRTNFFNPNDRQRVQEYTLSTAWDITTASYTTLFDVSAQDLAPTGLFFKEDGTKMYVLGDTGNDINEYTLSTAWSVSSASYVQNFSVVSQGGVPESVYFKSDGIKMYIVNGVEVDEYTLSTAWDISTASYVQSVSVVEANIPKGIHFKSDGTKMYVASSNNKLFAYTLSTAWDVSTASWDAPANAYFSLYTEELLPTGLFFKPDGTKMYVVGDVGNDVNEYNLSTAWDISTASYVQAFSVAAQEAGPQGIYFKPDGTKMHVVGAQGQDVNEYNLSTAWDISTATYVQNFSVAAQETYPTAIIFKPDGTKMYVVGANSKKVSSYTLNTAWDISTASWDAPVNSYFSVAAQDTTPTDVFFKPDGTKMYILGTANDSVNEYNLGTAWGVSTASYVQDFSVAAEETNPQGIYFKPDGKKMYIVGSTYDAIWAYTL